MVLSLIAMLIFAGVSMTKAFDANQLAHDLGQQIRAGLIILIAALFIIVIWYFVNLIRGLMHANGNMVDYIVYGGQLVYGFISRNFNHNSIILTTVIWIAIFAGTFVVRQDALKKESKDNEWLNENNDETN